MALNDFIGFYYLFLFDTIMAKIIKTIYLHVKDYFRVDQNTLILKTVINLVAEPHPEAVLGPV